MNINYKYSNLMREMEIELSSSIFFNGQYENPAL